MQDILLVEDDEDARLFYSYQLKNNSNKYLIHETASAEECLRKMAAMEFYCVIMDYRLKDTNALELVGQIKDKGLDHSPIIILTGMEDEELGIKLVQSGAQDYLIKSEINSQHLSRAIEYAAERHQLTVELERSHEKEHFLAYHDPLTALPNRQSFFRQLEQALAQVKRNDQKCSVLFLDLDGFKNINDTMGHASGDELLKKVAHRLESCVRGSDTVARLGGDEFTVVLANISEAQDVAKVAQKILETLTFGYTKGSLEFPVSASIGISMYPVDGHDAKTLVKNADIAMYRAKHQGKNSYQFYDKHMEVVAFERLALEMNMRKGLEQGEFKLYYLGQYSTSTHQLSGFEVLLRWNHPELGLLTPEKFIEVAENTGFIVPLGYWVMERACRDFKKWLENGLPPVRMSFNISGRQISDLDFEEKFKAIVTRAGLDLGLVGIEIAEETVRREIKVVKQVLGPLNQLGVKIFIDNFGRGFSSLSYLKSLPIDGIKIDQSFFEGIPGDENNEAIISAIIAMAQILQLEVVAEGIEHKGQIPFLKRLGCPQMQGFRLSRPMNGNDFFPAQFVIKGNGTTG